MATIAFEELQLRIDGHPTGIIVWSGQAEIDRSGHVESITVGKFGASDKVMEFVEGFWFRLLADAFEAAYAEEIAEKRLTWRADHAAAAADLANSWSAAP